ncbi:hypothetical protein PHISCL_10164 [Aspergillus sclerotialis]|uniref:Uncharacterized protein n=1 Tax=Aspergillus sclerotialis TaxID=2070753 RepID=A0A3A2Z396_9EURO|nr:hypothetical protein PHISCL_10164 [Aspergillus sclerotialis]
MPFVKVSNEDFGSFTELSRQGETLVLPDTNREAPRENIQGGIVTRKTYLKVLKVEQGFSSIGGWPFSVALDTPGFAG